ncbi:MAG: hypothetical protein ACK6A4_18600, partial [Alphaproteobacteria bacterium]
MLAHVVRARERFEPARFEIRHTDTRRVAKRREFRGVLSFTLLDKAQEYSGPILGLIVLRFAEVRFAAQRAKLEKAGASSRRGSRVDEPAAYHADNVLYLAPE